MPTTDELDERLTRVEADVAQHEKRLLAVEDSIQRILRRLEEIRLTLGDHEVRAGVTERVRNNTLESLTRSILAQASNGTINLRQLHELLTPLTIPGELPDLPADPLDTRGQVTTEFDRGPAPPGARVRGGG